MMPERYWNRKANGLKGEKVNALEASLVTSDKKSSLKEGLEVLLSL